MKPQPLEDILAAVQVVVNPTKRSPNKLLVQTRERRRLLGQYRTARNKRRKVAKRQRKINRGRR